MRIELLQEFVDPATGNRLRPEEIVEVEGQVKSGWLRSPDHQRTYPIRDFIPRFADSQEYAVSFGLQWQIHAKTQLDSHTGATYSRDRFFLTTGWPERMDGERILEAGCGAGRFTEVALATGAKVYSFDLSEAVVANYANSGGHPNLVLFQGSIYDIPFPKYSFDRVLCLGVLQHTPDVQKSFRRLAEMVKPGGSLAVDVYPRTWQQCLHWKYVMRPITTRMRPDRLYRLVSWYAPKLMPLARLMRRIGGKAGRRLVPILDQSDKSVSLEIQREWTILDTYDALSAAFDQPQTDATIRRWFDECGFTDVHFVAGQGHGTRTRTAG